MKAIPVALLVACLYNAPLSTSSVLPPPPVDLPPRILHYRPSQPTYEIPKEFGTRIGELKRIYSLGMFPQPGREYQYDANGDGRQDASVHTRRLRGVEEVFGVSIDAHSIGGITLLERLGDRITPVRKKHNIRI